MCIIHEKLIDMLITGRNKSRQETILNRAFSCQHHNFDLGGAAMSGHCAGLCADVKYYKNMSREDSVAIWLESGAKFIIPYDQHIHVAIYPSIHPTFKTNC